MRKDAVIPLFPLPIVVWPGERVPLHIYEPRYKQLINDCFATGEPFGISFVQEEVLYTSGCSVIVDEISHIYEDGRMDIVVAGKQRYHMVDTYDNKPYLMAAIRFFEDDQEPVERALQERAIELFYELAGVVGEALEEKDLFPKEGYPLSYRLAYLTGITSESKQRLLEITSENSRLQILIAYYEDYLPKVKQNIAVQRRVRGNGNLRDTYLSNEGEVE